MMEQTAGEKGKMVRVHRVGTITAGLMLIVFGMLFLLHMFLDHITYMMILRLWPIILISLGLEILIAQVQKNKTLVYDRGAVFIMICMITFSMAMALISTVLEQQCFWRL